MCLNELWNVTIVAKIVEFLQISLNFKNSLEPILESKFFQNIYHHD